jgi:choline dehydrogenase-like flavoprotein
VPIFRAVDTAGDREISADVVVVGSGAGGAVAAHEMAAAGYEVVLLERGPYHVTSEFRSDPEWSLNNLYAHRGLTAALGLPPILIPYGSCVGGTTVINSGTIFRAPAHILDAWAADFGVVEASLAEMRPFYDSIEARIGASESVWPALGEHNRVIARGVEALGLNGAPLMRNAPTCGGCGVCVFGCPTGAKQSMLVTFIPAADQLGARIFADTSVERILIEAGRVTGVEGRIVDRSTGVKRGKISVRAPVVIVAAGTFGTPGLLEANGVGARSGQLGRNLWIHPAGGAVAMMPETVRAWQGIPQGYMVRDWESEGILLEGGFGPPGVVGLMVPGFGADFQNRMADYASMAAFGVMVEDRDSVGSVSSAATGAPLIRYQLGRADARRLVFGIKQVARILFAAGAREVYPSIHGFEVLTDAKQIAQIDEARVAARDLTLSAYHPMGTCRMGEDPARTVVNSYLEVHGSAGLFVADASVFPSALGVNPQATVMAFAARTAAFIHRNHTRYFTR